MAAELNDRNEERLSHELRDKYFEAFKHLTTLNVATSIAMLAIYEPWPDNPALLVLPLLLFGLSLLAALSGMEVLLKCLRHLDNAEDAQTKLDDIRVSGLLRRDRPAGLVLRRSLGFSIVTYAGGLSGFAGLVVFCC